MSAEDDAPAPGADLPAGRAERPILFSGPMVRAILDGRKTQTRRPLKAPQPLDLIAMPGQEGRLWTTLLHRGESLEDNRGGFARCRYGEPGDRLWVRETFDEAEDGAGQRGVVYRADHGEARSGRWTPSIFMPRWASRLTLEIVTVRVQRVQTTSGRDAIAEGIDLEPRPMSERRRCQEARRLFRELWDRINAKRGFGWDTNPWVWVIEFRRAALAAVPAGGANG